MRVHLLLSVPIFWHCGGPHRDGLVGEGLHDPGLLKVVLLQAVEVQAAGAVDLCSRPSISPCAICGKIKADSCSQRDKGSGRVTISPDMLPRIRYWPDAHVLLQS